jgi:hypothetical protein
MSVVRFIQLASAIGLCLLIVPVRRLVPGGSTMLLDEPACYPMHPPPRSPSEAALRDAKAWRMQACGAAKGEMEAWETQDPAGSAIADQDAWRRGVLAVDHGGYLRRARAQARRAASLARTPAEASQAAELLVLLECESGHHAAELRQARRLVELQHGSWRSLTVLRRAALCTGQTALARETSAAVAALEARSIVHTGSPIPLESADLGDRNSHQASRRW